MPKKGGKRLADIDGQAAEGEAAEGTSEPTETAAEENESKGDVKQGQIEPKAKPAEPDNAKEGAAQGAKSEDVAPETEATPAPAAAKPIVAPQSQRQKQAAAAWEQQNKTTEKFYANVFQGVEKDIQSVNTSLQANATSAQDTLRNVSVANKLLWQISESLRSVDTLVVPIVLQRDGNF